jgi:hypothetical protein
MTPLMARIDSTTAIYAASVDDCTPWSSFISPIMRCDTQASPLVVIIQALARRLNG